MLKTMTITLTLNADEIKKLTISSMGCFYWEQKCRFEHDQVIDPELFIDWKSTMEWCANMTSAKIVKKWREQYDSAKVHILWDRYEENYVVLSTLICEEYKRKHPVK